jgi:nitrite reductase/ring-hydroxylating ferredoxin subunit
MTNRYPLPPFPSGWFLVAESSSLDVGEVRPIRYFGQDLVLFRTAVGAARIFDAHCPHMGAHVGFGGFVEGDGLRCPFHQWLFASDGTCANVPYSDRSQPKVALRSWPVEERGGLIFVCHDPIGTGTAWQLPERPEWDADGWVGYETVSWKVRMHTQEVAENVPDSTHFYFVHKVPTIPTVTVDIDGDVYRQHMVGRDSLGAETWSTRQEAFGLGLIWLSVQGPPQMKFLTAVTPIDEEFVELRLLFLVNEGTGAVTLSAIGRIAVDALIENTSRDIPIWEHKVYRERPPLVAGDGPIGQLRRWARQFYPEELAAT